MQVMNMEMQNLKPNFFLKNNLDFLLIFSLSWICLFTLYFEVGVQEKTKTKKNYFSVVIKESLQNCFIICVPSQIKKTLKGQKTRIHRETFAFSSLACFWVFNMPIILHFHDLY